MNLHSIIVYVLLKRSRYFTFVLSAVAIHYILTPKNICVKLQGKVKISPKWQLKSILSCPCQKILWPVPGCSGLSDTRNQNFFSTRPEKFLKTRPDFFKKNNLIAPAALLNSKIFACCVEGPNPIQTNGFLILAMGF